MSNTNTQELKLSLGPNGDWHGMEEHVWQPLCRALRSGTFPQEVILDLSRTLWLGLAEMVQLTLVPAYLRLLEGAGGSTASAPRLHVLLPDPQRVSMPQRAQHLRGYLERWGALDNLVIEGAEVPPTRVGVYSPGLGDLTSTTVLEIRRLSGTGDEADLVQMASRKAFASDPQLQGKTIIANAYGLDEVDSPLCIGNIFFELVDNVHNHAWSDEHGVMVPARARRAFYAWQFHKEGVPDIGYVRKKFDAFPQFAWRSARHANLVGRPFVELCVADVGVGVYTRFKKDGSSRTALKPAPDEVKVLGDAFLHHADEENFGLFHATMKTYRLGGYIELRSGGSCAAYDFDGKTDLAARPRPRPIMQTGLPYFPGTIVRVLIPAVDKAKR